METSGNFNEPADHLAIYPNCSAICIFRWERGPFLREERQFAAKNTDGTVGMVTRVCWRCHQYDSFGFYAALSQLLLG